MIVGRFSRDWPEHRTPVERPLAAVDEIWLSVLIGPGKGDYRRETMPLRGYSDTAATCSVVPWQSCVQHRRMPPVWKDVTTAVGRTRERFWYVKLRVREIEVALLAMAEPRASVILGLDFLKGLTLLLDFASENWRLGRAKPPASVWSSVAFWLYGLGKQPDLPSAGHGNDPAAL